MNRNNNINTRPKRVYWKTGGRHGVLVASKGDLPNSKIHLTTDDGLSVTTLREHVKFL